MTPPLLPLSSTTCRDFWKYLLVQGEKANEGASNVICFPFQASQSQIKGIVDGDKEHGFMTEISKYPGWLKQ